MQYYLLSYMLPMYLAQSNCVGNSFKLFVVYMSMAFQRTVSNIMCKYTTVNVVDSFHCVYIDQGSNQNWYALYASCDNEHIACSFTKVHGRLLVPLMCHCAFVHLYVCASSIDGRKIEVVVEIEVVAPIAHLL